MPNLVLRGSKIDAITSPRGTNHAAKNGPESASLAVYPSYLVQFTVFLSSQHDTHILYCTENSYGTNPYTIPP